MGLIEAAVFRWSDAVNTAMNASFPHTGRIDRIWQALFVVFVCVLVLPIVRPLWYGTSEGTRDGLWSHALILFLIPTALFCALLPSFDKDFLNPDEAFFVAAADKLLVDPVFYRSVDTGTSGPVNIYPLTLPVLMGGTVSYISARIVGWLLLAATIVCLYFAYTFLLGRDLGRLAIFPLFACVLLFGHLDFLHYSSERVSLFLTAGSIVLLASVLLNRTRWVRSCLFGIGLASGAMCCAKLQAIPTAFVLFLAGLAIAWAKRLHGIPRWSTVASIGLGVAAVPGLLLLMFYKSGVVTQFYRSYIDQNLAYAERIPQDLTTKMQWAIAGPFIMPELMWFSLGLLAFGLIAASDATLTQWKRRNANLLRFRIFLCAIILPGVFLFPHPMKSVALLLVLAAWVGYSRLSVVKRWPLRDCALYAFTCALTLAAIYSIAKPGNHYVHYLLWILIPISMCTALTVRLIFTGTPAESKTMIRMDRSWLGLFVLAVILMPAVLVVARPAVTPVKGVFGANSDLFRSRKFSPEDSKVVQAIRQHATKHESLVVWGWQSELYVMSGLVQGTRFGDSIFQISSPVHREFFRELYVSDFRASKPAVFVDAVGRGAFEYNNRALYGHETFPELAAIVTSEYDFIGEIGPDRIYARRSPERCAR